MVTHCGLCLEEKFDHANVAFIDRAGWGLLSAPGVPHGLQFLDFMGEGPRKIVRFAMVFGVTRRI